MASHCYRARQRAALALFESASLHGARPMPLGMVDVRAVEATGWFQETNVGKQQADYTCWTLRQCLGTGGAFLPGIGALLLCQRSSPPATAAGDASVGRGDASSVQKQRQEL
mmetsp:Transcript_174166/g.558492  ORF Transcript_174166/g.558492 Transcript_174166/m.558492 type:complete len:112 (+) Transcript_174166:100-435(+)|eukprot:CAMPEP_0203913560 /NCGR_PEP_ID=MMETSP0359-20131031/54540_1 /ASSEMBLY_ACC=CAM_ASM_000338 /TAXON_ID=268821 /ORGANISM="Scrippsiella Hangoei, Strain SHTV-5" /LENGTH=111 /DNA_ID=CAMNT_0050839727 /DNA_START=74 /DNA_END=409 /DNA_ORIENTATION=-